VRSELQNAGFKHAGYLSGRRPLALWLLIVIATMG